MQRVGEGRLGHATKGLAGSLLAILLVGSGVEGDEEEEVGSEDSNAGESSELLASAVAHVGHPVEVCRSEVGVRGEVDEAYPKVSKLGFLLSSGIITYRDQ